jgi:two-component sensor histidine kinase
MYTSDGNIKDGLALALDAARVAETPAGPVDGTGYEAVCRVYFVAGDYEKSMEYFYKVLPIFQRAPNLIGNAGGLFHRAIQIRLQQNKPVEALAFLQMITRPNSSLQLTYLDIQYFTISTADCYFAIGKRDSAERYYLRALDLVPDSRYTPSKSLVYNSLAGYFTATGQYARAKPFLDTLMADSNRALNSVTILENAHRLRYKADSAMGNYPAAMAHLLQYGILRDSLTNITRNKQFAEMSVQFETEKKNQHIADLEKQNALQGRLQAITVRQDRIVRNSLIAGAALLILLAAVFYTRSRTRRRMARRLQKLSDRQEKLLREREWLLREIHHRVRNNLQIVISLLRLQSGQFTDATAISAFEEISARVNAISLVHKKLYQEGQDLSSINMREYIRELVGFLQDCLGAQQAIIFTLDIEPLALDVAQCVPLGLILNEAVTNSIKHAFPNGSPPMPAITISLYEEQGWLTARIADNGIGLPAGATLLQTTSLGMQLIHTFTLQLEGTLTIDGNGGAGPAVNREPASNGGAASNGGPGGDAIPAAAMPGLKMEICFPRATTSDAN